MKRKIVRWLTISIVLFAAWLGIVFLAGAVISSRVPVSIAPFAHIFSLGDDYVAAERGLSKATSRRSPYKLHKSAASGS